MRQRYFAFFLAALCWVVPSFSLASSSLPQQAKTLVFLAQELESPHQEIVLKVASKLAYHVRSDSAIYGRARPRFLAFLLEKLAILIQSDNDSGSFVESPSIGQIQIRAKEFKDSIDKDALLEDGAVLGLGPWLVSEVLSAESLSKIMGEQGQTLGQTLMLNCGLYAVVAHAAVEGMDSPLLSGLKYQRGGGYDVLNELLREKLSKQAQEKKHKSLPPIVRGIKKSGPGTMIIAAGQLRSIENIDFALDLLDLLSGSIPPKQLKSKIADFHRKKIRIESGELLTYAQMINIRSDSLEYLKSIDAVVAVKSFWGPRIDLVGWMNHMANAYYDVTANIKGDTMGHVSAARRRRPAILPNQDPVTLSADVEN